MRISLSVLLLFLGGSESFLPPIPTRISRVEVRRANDVTLLMLGGKPKFPTPIVTSTTPIAAESPINKELLQLRYRAAEIELTTEVARDYLSYLERVQDVIRASLQENESTLLQSDLKQKNDQELKEYLINIEKAIASATEYAERLRDEAQDIKTFLFMRTFEPENVAIETSQDSQPSYEYLDDLQETAQAANEYLNYLKMVTSVVDRYLVEPSLRGVEEFMPPAHPEKSQVTLPVAPSLEVVATSDTRRIAITNSTGLDVMETSVGRTKMVAGYLDSLRKKSFTTMLQSVSDESLDLLDAIALDPSTNDGLPSTGPFQGYLDTTPPSKFVDQIPPRVAKSRTIARTTTAYSSPYLMPRDVFRSPATSNSLPRLKSHWDVVKINKPAPNSRMEDENEWESSSWAEVEELVLPRENKWEPPALRSSSSVPTLETTAAKMPTSPYFEEAVSIADHQATEAYLDEGTMQKEDSTASWSQPESVEPIEESQGLEVLENPNAVSSTSQLDELSSSYWDDVIAPSLASSRVNQEKPPVEPPPGPFSSTAQEVVPSSTAQEVVPTLSSFIDGASVAASPLQESETLTLEETLRQKETELVEETAEDLHVQVSEPVVPTNEQYLEASEPVEPEVSSESEDQLSSASMPVAANGTPLMFQTYPSEDEVQQNVAPDELEQGVSTPSTPEPTATSSQADGMMTATETLEFSRVTANDLTNAASKDILASQDSEGLEETVAAISDSVLDDSVSEVENDSTSSPVEEHESETESPPSVKAARNEALLSYLDHISAHKVTRVKRTPEASTNVHPVSSPEDSADETESHLEEVSSSSTTSGTPSDFVEQTSSPKEPASAVDYEESEDTVQPEAPASYSDQLLANESTEYARNQATMAHYEYTDQTAPMEPTDWSQVREPQESIYTASYSPNTPQPAQSFCSTPPLPTTADVAPTMASYLDETSSSMSSPTVNADPINSYLNQVNSCSEPQTFDSKYVSPGSMSVSTYQAPHFSEPVDWSGAAGMSSSSATTGNNEWLQSDDRFSPSSVQRRPNPNGVFNGGASSFQSSVNPNIIISGDPSSYQSFTGEQDSEQFPSTQSYDQFEQPQEEANSSDLPAYQVPFSMTDAFARDSNERGTEIARAYEERQAYYNEMDYAGSYYGETDTFDQVDQQAGSAVEKKGGFRNPLSMPFGGGNQQKQERNEKDARRSGRGFFKGIGSFLRPSAKRKKDDDALPTKEFVMEEPVEEFFFAKLDPPESIQERNKEPRTRPLLGAKFKEQLRRALNMSPQKNRVEKDGANDVEYSSKFSVSEAFQILWGRIAMVFIVAGLAIELQTGATFPAQFASVMQVFSDGMQEFSVVKEQLVQSPVATKLQKAIQEASSSKLQQSIQEGAMRAYSDSTEQLSMLRFRLQAIPPTSVVEKTLQGARSLEVEEAAVVPTVTTEQAPAADSNPLDSTNVRQPVQDAVVPPSPPLVATTEKETDSPIVEPRVESIRVQDEALLASKEATSSSGIETRTGDEPATPDLSSWTF